MSLEPILWALKDAPVADTTERLILTAMAERADSDGCEAFPSKPTMAKIAMCDEKTVQRKLAAMVARKLIALGDQSAARYIEERYRPNVYDLLIPCSWFGAERLERVNEERRQKGRPPLTPQNRPDIAPAPPKTRRSDAGKKRHKDESDAEPVTSIEVRGDSQSPLREDSQSPLPDDSGGTDSPSRGDSQSQQGGLRDPQTTPMNLPMNHPLSGAGVAGEAEAADGSPDSGSGKPDRRMTKKEEAAAKRAAKTAQEREWDDLAQADATLWWEYAEKRFGPDAGGRGGFLALRGMIRRALGAGYSAAQIREALRFANVRVPSKQSWDAALAKASGHQVPGGNPRQQRQPAYVATPKQHDDQAPAVRTQEQLDELFGATG